MKYYMNFVFVVIFGVTTISGVDCRSALLFSKRDNISDKNGTQVEDNSIAICTKYSAFIKNDTTIQLRGKISVITRLSS